MNNNDIKFTAQKIRSQYTEKQTTELDELRRIDAKAKRPAKIFSYIFGSVSAIVMGAGMSLVMTDVGATVGIDNNMHYGIIIGILGMAMAIINYPIYTGILSSRRKKYSAKIIELSNKIVNQ